MNVARLLGRLVVWAVVSVAVGGMFAVLDKSGTTTPVGGGSVGNALVFPRFAGGILLTLALTYSAAATSVHNAMYG